MGDLKTFPSNYYEALAFLYVQNQDLSQKNPTEVLEMYMDAKEEVVKAYGDYKKRKRESNSNQSL